MPIVESLMANLKRQYGEKKGEDVYYAMEAGGKGPFAKGAKHHDLHEDFAQRNGVQPIQAPGTKKPRSRKPGGGAGRAQRGNGYKRKRR